MIVSNVLSIWEVAHRWHGLDPNLSDPAALPLSVQDALRLMCRVVFNGGLDLYEPIVIYPDGKEPPFSRQVWSAPLKEIPPELEDCFLHRRYDKSVLDAAYIARDELFFWCTRFDHAFPDFWFDDSLLSVVGGSPQSDSASAPAKKLKSSQLDKLLCQAIAQTLWDVDPKINISAMARHKAIKIYGNGGQYTDDKTVRNWILEVAPQHLRNKPGRPPKSEA